MDEGNKRKVEAYIDGAMKDSEKKEFIQMLSQFPAMQNYYRALVKQRALLKKWWDNQKHH